MRVWHSIIFFILAFVCAVLGWGNYPQAIPELPKALFCIFTVLCILSMLYARELHEGSDSIAPPPTAKIESPNLNPDFGVQQGSPPATEIKVLPSHEWLLKHSDRSCDVVTALLAFHEGNCYHFWSENGVCDLCGSPSTRNEK